MIGLFGQTMLVLSILLCALHIAYPKKALHYKLPLCIFVTVSSAFLGLITAYIISDFSLLNVYQNSHSAKPLIYKISGSWGNHEGSFLLWVVILSGFSAAFFAFSAQTAAIKSTTLQVQSLLLAIFLLFIIFFSNPFTLISPAPTSGLGLNPLLQDIGLVIHPPMLYLGYVGFSILFSAAIAALLHGEISSQWARTLQPWALISWCFLSLGIGLGAWWAYHELGWGGFWFWDPVENASLMPWLLGTALLHSLIVTKNRQLLKHGTLLLAIFTFGFSLIGTFLVRSGMLTSVHAFANDPERGIFILLMLTVIVGAALVIFMLKASNIHIKGGFSFISTESFIIFNNVLLVVACITILITILYPLILEMLSLQQITVGKPYFNTVFNPLAILTVGLAAIGVLLGWHKDTLKRVAKKYGYHYY